MEGKFAIIILLFGTMAVMGKLAQENDGKSTLFSFILDSAKRKNSRSQSLFCDIT